VIGPRVPASVLTGFLGSGKTTLVQRLLACPEGSGVAVLVNELGEIGLDHLLVKAVTETAVVLQNGCICCMVRTDVQRALRDLIDGRALGKVPPFRRILIETSGLADPVPILQTLASDPMLRGQVRLANVITTVEAPNGLGHLEEFEESRQQVAVADRLVLTKADLVSEQVSASLQRRLVELNPTAALLSSRESDAVLWGVLLDRDAFDRDHRSADAHRWLRCMPAGRPATVEHTPAMGSFSIRVAEPVDWTAFAVWLSALVHRHGDKLLRVKGLLNIPDAPGPVVLHAVQRYVHPPFHLDAWPDEDRSSRLVFIVKDLEPAAVERSLYDALGSLPAAAPPARARA
jgi:G3E family GTPase